MATTIAEEVVGVLRGESPRYPVNDPIEVERVRQKLGLLDLSAVMTDGAIVRSLPVADSLDQLVVSAATSVDWLDW